MTINFVMCLAILVYVDTSGENEQIQAHFPLSQTCECILDLLEITHVAFHPFDLRCWAGFLLDFVDGILSLVFFAVHHNDSGTVEDKRACNLVPNAQRAACDQSDSTAEVVDFLFGPNYWLQDGLHCVCVCSVICADPM